MTIQYYLQPVFSHDFNLIVHETDYENKGYWIFNIPY